MTNRELYDSIIDGSLVKRLRRRPLTAETRVRFPYGLLTILIIAQPEDRCHSCDICLFVQEMHHLDPVNEVDIQRSFMFNKNSLYMLFEKILKSA